MKKESINQPNFAFFLRAALLLQLSIFEGTLKVWKEAVIFGLSDTKGGSHLEPAEWSGRSL